LNKKGIFEQCRKFEARKTLLIDIIFAMKKVSIDLFRAAPYMFMLTLHKEVLFHFILPVARTIIIDDCK
jgi:hypothetical protein